MAYCPQCSAAMGQTDIICPDCGFDFPSVPADFPVGLAHSRLADVALHVAAAISFLASIAAALWMVRLLLYVVIEQSLREWQQLVLCPFVFLFFYALFAAFVRVRKV